MFCQGNRIDLGANSTCFPRGRKSPKFCLNERIREEFGPIWHDCSMFKFNYCTKSEKMWREDVYNLLPYSVASVEVSGGVSPHLLTSGKATDYSNFITDYRDLFTKGQITDDMLPDGLHQVADPLIRSALLLKSGDFSDVMFMVGEDEEVEVTLFEVHKFQLVTASPVFFTMFYGSLPEGAVVRVRDVVPAAFQTMLEYIYCGLIPKTISAEHGIATLYVARKYMLERLEDILVMILSRRIILGEAFLLYKASFFFDLPMLTRVTQDFIDTHTQELVASPEWLEIDTATMLKVIRSDNLKIPEIDLFQALLKWSGAGDRFLSTGKSLKRLSACLPYIRFPTMSSAEFANGPAKFMGKEDIANILLHICTTVGVKPGCRFCTTPRNYTPHLKKQPYYCDCYQKGLNCFFCTGVTGNGGSQTTSQLSGRPPSRRSPFYTTPTPPCYCACRTRGSCPGAQRLGPSDGLGIIRGVQPSLVSSPALPPRVQALARRNVQVAQNNRIPPDRPLWRI